jgi:RIP metalloprotease RseP
VTDIIDPEAGSPAGPESPPDPHTVMGAGGFGSYAEPVAVTAAEPDPEESTSRILPTLGFVALIVVIVHFFGWWGLFLVAGLVGSVVLHEFGHYLTAKQAGMKVTEFFVGFGPKLFSFTRGETEYGVKPLPLGAYVRIIGMNDLEDVEPGDEGRTYREKSYWARLRVVLAGPATNLAIAFILLMVVVVAYGQSSNKDWTVGSVVHGSAAAAAGLAQGDRLISLNGKPVGDFSTTFINTIEHHAGHPVTLVVERNGKQLTIVPTVGWDLAAAGAAKLNPLQEGDQVVSVDGVAVHDYGELSHALATTSAARATLVFERNNYLYSTTVPTPMTLPANGSHGFLGISATPRHERVGPLTAVSTSASTFGSIVTGSVSSLGHFFSPSGLTSYTHYVLTNKVPPAAGVTNPDPAPIVAVSKGAPSPSADPATAMASPANNRLMSIFGVLRLGSQAAGAGGLDAILMLLVLINVFLGLLNLVPLPPFDGGHAAVATYEVIRERLSGRPYRADMAKLIPVTYAVLVVMAFIFLSTSYLDLLHPVANPYGR